MRTQAFGDLLIINIPEKKPYEVRAILSHYYKNQAKYEKILKTIKYNGKIYLALDYTKYKSIRDKIKKPAPKYSNKDVIIRNLYFRKENIENSKLIANYLKNVEQDVLDEISKDNKFISKIKIRDKEYYEIAYSKIQDLKYDFKKNNIITSGTKDIVETDKEQDENRTNQTINGPLVNRDISNVPKTITQESIGSMKPTKIPSSNVSVKSSSKIVKGEISPGKIRVKTVITKRNQSTVKYLKDLYRDICQICQERVEITIGEYVSEVHHIKPLGKHNGPDVIDNMIVLCPNHHAMFDNGAITFNVENQIVVHTNNENIIHGKKMIYKHNINPIYVDYHDQNIFKGNLSSDG